MKPLSDFCKSKNQKDGLEPRCRACRSASAAKRNARPEVKHQKTEYARKWRKLNPEKYSANYKKHNPRKENIERRRVSTARWLKTAAGKASRRRQILANPEKFAARTAVMVAVRTGALVKPKNCTLCGDGGRIEGHHHNGYAPQFHLDVTWLCCRCHNQAHRAVAA
jgi:hypothetical protein